MEGVGRKQHLDVITQRSDLIGSIEKVAGCQEGNGTFTNAVKLSRILFGG
jgi:hypothetical protein